MVKIDLADRLEGIDPFGRNVLLDEGIMAGILRQPHSRQPIHTFYSVLTNDRQPCLLDAG